MYAVELPGFGSIMLSPVIWFGHLSYALVALSFLLRDVLLLRLVAIAAALCNIAFAYSFGAQPNWIPIFWQSLFIAINVGWSARLIYERRGVVLSEDERELYRTLFRQFTPFEFLKLLHAGQWRTAAAGVALATSGANLDELLLIYNGEVEVALPDGGARRLKDGAFLGEISLLRGGPATATVRTMCPTRYIAWPKAGLKQLLQRNPAMRFAMQGVISEDLTRKLLNHP